MAAFAAIFVVAAFALSLPGLAYANEGKADAAPVLQADSVEHDGVQLDCEAVPENTALETEDVLGGETVEAEEAHDNRAPIPESEAAEEEASGDAEAEFGAEPKAEKGDQAAIDESVEEAPALMVTSDSESPTTAVPLERDYDPVAVISTGEGAETVRS